MEPSPTLNFSTAGLCFTFLENNEKFALPIISNKYHVNIKNNFAEMKSSQVYQNPFKRPLEIHYSIPTDPNFCIGRVVAIYNGLTVEGLIKEKEKVKAEYKEAKEKGNTVMMASTDKTEKSVLRVRLGNLLPSESVRIEFEMLGKLNSELPNCWTLRIPSHIGPRYQTQADIISHLFKQLCLSNPDEVSGYNLANTEWDFRINLFSTKKVVKAVCPSHKVDETVFSESFRSYSLSEDKLPEKDL